MLKQCPAGIQLSQNSSSSFATTINHAVTVVADDEENRNLVGSVSRINDEQLIEMMVIGSWQTS
jgi:hypothetical protein